MGRLLPAREELVDHEKDTTHFACRGKRRKSNRSSCGERAFSSARPYIESYRLAPGATRIPRRTTMSVNGIGTVAACDASAALSRRASSGRPVTRVPWITLEKQGAVAEGRLGEQRLTLSQPCISFGGIARDRRGDAEGQVRTLSLRQTSRAPW